MNTTENARRDDWGVLTGKNRDKGGEPFPVCDCTTSNKGGQEATQKNRLKPSAFTDVGNAAVFASLHKADLSFSDALGWLSWTGQYWKSDGGEHDALQFAIDFSEAMLSEARDDDREARKALAVLNSDKAAGHGDADKLKKGEQAAGAAAEYLKHARATQRAGRIKSICDLSKPRFVKPVELFDRDWYLLNTPAGIVDLRNGQIFKHDPQAYCAKITAASPCMDGMEQWENHLNFVTCGDVEEKEYLQIKIGSCLYGKVFEEKADFANGDGDNGKSTFYNTIFIALGNYAAAFDVDILTDLKSGEFKREAAGLRGVRYCLGGELEQGRKLSTSVLKRLVSTDPIHAEFKYHDGFDYIPSHSTIIYTNHLPQISSFDSGTWRRINIVPFNAKLTEEQKIPNYADILVNQCGGAALKWAIEGAVKFHQCGYKIKVPASVKMATDRYRMGQNWLTPFINSGAVDTDNVNARTGARELYTHYQKWAEQTGANAHNENEFSEALAFAGYRQIRPKNKRTWVGIQPAADVEIL